MAEIKTIIRADSTQHDSTVRKSANEVYKYQKRADDAKKSMAQMGNSVKNVAGSFLKSFIPAVGGALTALEGFKKMMKSTEEGTDALDRALYTAKSSVNQFFKALGSGNFDNFILGLQDIKKNAKEAYDALDNLGTVEMWVKIEKAKLDADMAIQRAIISNANSTQLEKAEAQRKLNLSQETYDRLSGIIKTNAENAFNKSLREVSGVGDKYVSQYDLNKWLSMREQDALNGTNNLEKALTNFFNEHATVSKTTSYTSSITGGGAYTLTTETWDDERNRQTYVAMKNLFNATDETIQDLGNLQIKISNEERTIADRQNQINRINNKVNGGSGGSSGKGSNSPTYDDGSIAWYDAQIKALQDLINNQKLSAEELNNIQNQISKLEQQKLEYVQGLRGGKLDLIPMLEPIKPKIEEIKITAKEAIEEVKEEFIDLISVGNALGDTVSSLGSIFNSLGDIAGDTDGEFLKMFGDIASHISNILPKVFSLIAAEEGEALAAGTASAAKLPFPYNLAAIASIVAELIAVFATIESYSGKAFAEGGIVGGATSIGDYNLARVNAGEMILNGRQQNHLFNMLNGIGTPESNGVSGNVVFTIRGNDLVGTLNNYNKKMGRVQ